MKKRILSIILAVVMIAGMIPLGTLTAFAAGEYTSYFDGGIGTVDDPYLIATKAQLENLAELSEGGSSASQFRDTYFKLTADIGTPDDPFTKTIGNIHSGFRGYFDGNGHTVTLNLTNDTAAISYGLFLNVSVGTIKNLITAGNINLKDVEEVGGIVGVLGRGATIFNCMNAATINVTYTDTVSTSRRLDVGGICGGTDRGSVTNCVNVGKIVVNTTTTTATPPIYRGEIAGLLGGPMTNCFGLTGTDNEIIGINNGTVSNSDLLPDAQMKAVSNAYNEEWVIIDGSIKPLVDLLNGYTLSDESSDYLKDNRKEWKATGISYSSFDGALCLSDILAANTDFPTKASEGWQAESGAVMYVYENHGVTYLAANAFGKSIFLHSAYKLSQVTTGVYEITDSNGKWTLNVDKDGTTLTSVTFAHAQNKEENAKYDGTYQYSSTPSTLVDVPTFSDNIVYNGEEQTGVADGTGYTVTNGKATDAGTYTATATLEEGYFWSDETFDGDIVWTIARADAKVKANDIQKTYGEDDPEYTATVTGTFGDDTLAYTFDREEGTDIGTYEITVTGEAVQDNYNVTYEGGTLTINLIGYITIPTAKTGLVYNGEEQTGVAEGTGYTVTNGKATNAGEYTATATLEDGYFWSDETTEPKEISWTIEIAVVTVPETKSFTYTGEEQTGVEENEGYTLSGVSKATNAGIYKAVVTLKDNYIWSDKTTDPKEISWTIESAVVTVPETKYLNYTGEEQTGVEENKGYTLSGVSKATNAGIYSAVATLKDNYIWSDNTTEPKNILWVISPAAPATHEHTFATEYSYNETDHWQAATCEHTEYTKNLGEHTFDQNGKCTVCGYEKKIDALTETKTAMKAQIDTAANGASDAIKSYAETAKGEIDECTSLTALVQKYTDVLNTINSMKTAEAIAAATKELEELDVISTKAKAIVKSVKPLLAKASSPAEVEEVMKQAKGGIDAAEEKVTDTDRHIVNRLPVKTDNLMGHQYKIVNGQVINDVGRAIICLTEEQLNKIKSDKVVVVGGDFEKETTFTLDCAYTYFYSDEKQYTAEEIGCAAFLIIDHDAVGGAISGFGYYRVYDGSTDSEDNFILDALYVNPNN